MLPRTFKNRPIWSHRSERTLGEKNNVHDRIKGKELFDVEFELARIRLFQFCGNNDTQGFIDL